MNLLKELHKITSDDSIDFEQKVNALLRFGSEAFKLPLGIVSHILGDVYTVCFAVSPNDELAPGMQFNAKETYCFHTLEAHNTVSFEHVAKSRIVNHPCYQNFGLECYIGAPLHVAGKPYGTLNFSSPEPRSKPFTEEEHDYIRLLAQWVGVEMTRAQLLNDLRHQRNVMRQAEGLAHVGSIEFEMSSGKTYFSEEARQILAVEKDTAFTLDDFLTRIADDGARQKVADAFKRVCQSQGHFSDTFAISQGDKPKRQVALTLKSKFNQDECERVYCSLHDVTEFQRLSDALNQKRIEAELALASRSRFLANMSHEIRTPMNGVIGLIDSVIDTDLDKEQTHFLSLAKQSAESLLSLINDILDFSKIDSGDLAIERISTDIKALINATLAPFENAIKEKGLTLNMEFAGFDDTHTLMDPLRLRQIVTNLVSNAFKFTSKGSISVKAQLTQGVTNTLKIAVTDTGIGMNNEALKNLFTPFNQADSSTSRKYGGTGLGLSISKHLAQLLGGDISVSSKEGKGTTFTVSLPVTLCEPKAPTEKPKVITPELHDVTVLVAEDNPVNQIVIEQMLQKLTVSYTLVNNGQEALEALNTNDYDAILMDCQMPVMDGYSATEAIRQSKAPYQFIPIIALTANAMKGEKEKCLAIGMNGYLAKPMSLVDLKATLGEVLARAH